MSIFWSIRNVRSIIFCIPFLFLIACGSDNDAPPASFATIVQDGYLQNIEGIEYTSGSTSGVTGIDGSFTYEKDTIIKFAIGDIDFGEVPAKPFITPLDLVRGAIDETNIVAINIYRLLLSLDNDKNFANGLKITKSIRENAVGRTINFDQSEIDFETNIKPVVTALLNAGNRDTVLVSAVIARAELHRSLIDPYQGYYEGVVSGDVNGIWAFVVSTSGNIYGQGLSNDNGSLFSLTGVMKIDGKIVGGNISSGATFAGEFRRDGEFTANWINTQSNKSGTLSGKKTTPPENNGTDNINTAGTITTDPLLLDGVALFNTVTADFASYNSTNIVITAPEIAANGAVVPVTVNFPSNSGTLWLYADINDEKLAAKVDYITTIDNGYLATRIKMKQTGFIVAVFDDGTGTLIAAQAKVKITIGSVPHTCMADNCSPALDSTSIRLRDSGGTFKMLLTRQMNLGDYINKTTVTFNGMTNTVVYSTPYLSKNPYISVKHALGVGLTVTADVLATNGRAFSQTVVTTEATQ